MSGPTAETVFLYAVLPSDGFGFGQGFQIVGALDEDALVAGAAQARKEAQGNADHQGAGAADHQEGQGAVQPGAPVAVKPRQQTHHRRQHRQGQGRPAHGGGIHPGELGDEVLRLGLVGAGIFHQLQDFGHGGLAEGPGGADLQHAGHVDARTDVTAEISAVTALCTEDQFETTSLHTERT